MPNVGYIYKTTNLVNGKLYIGLHQRFEFDKKYYGSGNNILSAIKKYGRKNFTVEILMWASSIERLARAEKYFIKAFDSTNKKNGYNISPGGQFYKPSKKKKKHDPWNKGKKMSKEFCNTISEIQKGKIPWKATIAAQKANKGRKQTEESKVKISESSKGKPGTRNGVKTSEETKMKQSESNKGKHSVPMKKETKEKLSRHWKNKPWSAKRRAAYERTKLTAC